MEGEHCAYIQLSGRHKTCLQLGRELQSSLRVQNQIQVQSHGDGWYSANFSCQEDYDQAFQTRRWRIPGCNSIYYCRWQPNFRFKKLRPLLAGDIVEGGVKFLPLEYYRDDLVLEIANAVCLPLGCRVFMVDSSSEGKLPRFLFVYNGSQLPSQIPIDDGETVVGLSYSLAQKCSNCRGYGHIGSTCTTRSSYSSGSAQVHPHHPLSGSAPIADPLMPSLPDDIGAAQELNEEAIQVAPIPVLNDIPRSSGITSPTRSVVEKNMPPEGAMIVEKGEERKPILYSLEEKVSEIHVSVEVKHLKDKNGNLRKITINPHTGDAPNYTKRVLCTSIDGADATSTLEEMCHGKGASLVVVLDKSSVLVNDDQIHTKLGFSASHRVEMTFRRAEANGSVLYVKGNCLLMWKAEEVRVSVDTELSSSEHLKFNASWMIGGVTTRSVEGLGNYSNSSNGSDLEGPSSYPTAPEELSTESANVLPVDTPGGDAPTSNYGDTFPRELHPYQYSTPSSPRSEHSYSGPAVYDESPHRSHDINISSSDHGDTDAEGSSAASDASPPGSPGSNVSYLDHGYIDADGSSGDERDPLPNLGEDFNNEAEEISCGSSAPSASSSSSSSS